MIENGLGLKPQPKNQGRLKKLDTIEPIIIARQLESGGGFAVRVNGGGAIYIPPSVGPIEEEDVDKEFLAKLKPSGREDTPWRAVFVDFKGRVKTDPKEFVYVSAEVPAEEEAR